MWPYIGAAGGVWGAIIWILLKYILTPVKRGYAKEKS